MILVDWCARLVQVLCQGAFAQYRYRLPNNVAVDRVKVFNLRHRIPVVMLKIEVSHKIRITPLGDRPVVGKSPLQSVNIAECQNGRNGRLVDL